MTKSRLALMLNLIGASLLNQSQSAVKQHSEMAEYFRHSTGNCSGQVVYLPLLVIAQHLEDIASRSKCRCYC